MKRTSIIVLMCSIFITLSANASEKYTMEQIYNNMCIQCHSSDGSGNTEKLTPSMTDLSESEIRDSLLDVEDDNGHVIMEHNRGQILKKGMEYSAKDMATYMYKRFTQK